MTPLGGNVKTSDFRRSDMLRGERIPDDLLRVLPKTDLHCHLDGSLRLETFLELGRREGLGLPEDSAEARRLFLPASRVNDQQELLKYFEHSVAVLQRPEHLQRVARELALDAADVGCWYLEVRFCPLLHAEQGMSPDETVAAVQRGLQEAEQECRIVTGIIITGLRTISASVSLELAHLAVDWKGRGVVAFDLAGAEEHYPAKDHREAFYHVINNNMNSTLHAGEGFGPASIHQALHHGTRLLEDPDLLNYVNDHRIPLEVCLTSSVQSGVVKDIPDHPLRYYMNLGLRVTLNTDSTLFVRTNILEELRRAVRAFDLTLLETENLLLNGFKSAFLPEKRKSELIAEALATFSSLRDKHGLDELPVA
jgi:adenosine deaminase